MKNHSCRFSAFAQNRKTGNVNYMQLDCMTWKCSKCSCKLKKAWGVHVATLFESESNGLWRIKVDDMDWPAVYVAIRRGGGEHIRIRTTNGHIIFTNVPVKGAEHFCKHDATATARRDINAIPIGRRGVSTSRKWKLKQPKQSTHRLISTAQVNPFAVKKGAADNGVEYREWKPKDYSSIHNAIELRTCDLTDEGILSLIDKLVQISAPRYCQDYSDTSLKAYSGNYDRLMEFERNREYEVDVESTESAHLVV